MALRSSARRLAGVVQSLPAGGLENQSWVGLKYTPQTTHAARLVNDFRFHTLETLDAVIEEHKAAVFNRIEVSYRGGAPVVSEVCDLWEFDADGKVTSLRQFVDTDLIRRLIGVRP
jgi:ketosteroid isomerase-like protein